MSAGGGGRLGRDPCTHSTAKAAGARPSAGRELRTVIGQARDCVRTNPSSVLDPNFKIVCPRPPALVVKSHHDGVMTWDKLQHEEV